MLRLFQGPLGDHHGPDRAVGPEAGTLASAATPADLIGTVTTILLETRIKAPIAVGCDPARDVDLAREAEEL